LKAASAGGPRYYLWNDLAALGTIGQQEPWLLGLFASCLIAWHAAAIGRLVFLLAKPTGTGHAES
jgi:hypothetical protein